MVRYVITTGTVEFESHWAPHSFGLVPHRSKALCKLHHHRNSLNEEPCHRSPDRETRRDTLDRTREEHPLSL